MKWIELNDINQLGEIATASQTRAQIIFKHSTQCNISADALAEMNRFEGEAWYLDLLAHRDISNQIAEQFQIRHQSPQVLIIKNNEVVYHESHWRIKAELVQEAAAS
ncbi:MAG: bacillithiol system redox-active protein YtxJ [Taibaiella sp.]|nr:bacillithiol system redox-active protein YtxJ [Taibaiella sp.]